MEITENANFSKRVKRMLGLDLESWNNVLIGSLVLAAIAATILGVATFVVIRLQDAAALEAKQEFERYRIEAGVKIEEAKKEGVKAGEAAGNALVRAAELEKEAANARLETEKIKDVVAWRVIPSATMSELQRALAAKPGSVNLRYTDGDPEALYLAIQISHILANAHWQVAVGALKLPNAIVFGISLPDINSPDASTLRAAFTAAHVPFSTDALPQGGIGFLTSTISGAPILMVGSKMPAFP